MRTSSADGARRASRAALLLTMGLLATGTGCHRSEPSPAPPGADSSLTAPVPPSTAVSRSDAADAGDASAAAEPVDAGAADEAAYLHAKPLSGKSIGHTSVVFRMKLDGGLEATFKPRSHRGDRRYRGEVAAYRLSRALGLSNVPPAMIRVFDGKALAAAVGNEPLYAAEVVPEANGDVVGALRPWMKKLDYLELEKEPWASRWRAWLARGGAIPEEDRRLAAQISTMVAFDWVTGNWDRWSGGNVGSDPATHDVLFIDNDGAFYDAPPAAALTRQWGYVEHVDRYSRAFVAALRALDVKTAFGEETPGTPLLTARARDGVAARRTKLLAAIDAKIARDGEASVLAFP